MASLQQFIDSIDVFTAEIAGGLRELTIANAIEAAEIASSRIIETGRSSSGTALTSYSTKKVPAYLFSGLSNNQRGERFVENAMSSGTPISYKDFRNANGLPTDHVTLSFTGRMWSSLGVKQVQDSNGKVRVVVGGRTIEGQGKLDKNSDKYGVDILKLTENEILSLQQNFGDFIDQKARQVLRT